MMRDHSYSLVATFSGPIKNFQLVYQLTRREVLGRYRGSAIGLLWSLFHPLLMLGVYTFFFGVVFKARWSAGQPEHGFFAVNMLHH